jgi:hypothetical protein
LKLTLHGYINSDELPQDTGATGVTLPIHVIKNVGDEQIKNTYKAATQGNGNSLVAGWSNPLDNIVVTSPFGPRNGRQHEGNDLRAALGTNVYAVLDGVVVSSQAQSGYGYAIILSHPNNGLSTLYGHVRERLVSAGDTVSSGQLIAKSGDEGSPGEPHLHFEILKNAISLDNSNYFSSANQALITDPEPYLTGQVIPTVNDNLSTKGTALTSAEKAKKGAGIAKKLMSDLGLTNVQAVGSVGNLIAESGLIPDRIQGGGVKVGKLKINGATGYGYAQWTTSNRQQNLANYAKSMGVDYTQKNLTDDINYGFLVKEFKDSYSGVLSKLKTKTTVRSATEWIMKEWERPKDQSDGKVSERTGYSQQVLEAMG